MKNIKKLLVFALLIGFTASSFTSCSPKTYKKGKKKKKRGCNCPSFSADAMNETIAWENAIHIKKT